MASDLFRREIALSVNQWWTERDCDAIAAGMNTVFRAFCTPA
jgi:hypothetical protein